ncbi:MAG: UDP-3-O-(3-hydroxymyristoyl)glucosamine N-acyltransferase [Flavobacteriales bacterium]|nr:MAG: UDP-3-O-(3-hydroxymyristoyl)glucosamine N-acyltransferase [Flavobacteriales bacterium]
MTIRELLGKLVHEELIGDPDAVINAAVPLDPGNTRPDVISWCNMANVPKLASLKAGAVIVPADAAPLPSGDLVHFIRCKDPRGAFRDVFNLLHPPRPRVAFRSPSAIVHPSATIGRDVHIGHNVVVDEGCAIGDGSIIGHNSVLLNAVQVGKRVVIGCNCTIGGTGFGYQPDANGDQVLMPHMGSVVLGDDVEIGNNTCIDRGGLGNTVLERNVKVDNLVHIAHNAVIGENSLVIAHAMVAGSCKVGRNAWIAPNAAIRNKVNVGDNATVGLGAVVVKDVADGTVVAGNPARPMQGR